jgi:hypothetical protein
MDSQIPSRRKALEDALQEFLREYGESLEAEEISEVLQEISESFGGSEEPTIEVFDDEPLRLELTYPSPQSLERELPALLDLRGLQVAVDLPVPLLTDMILDVRLEGLPDVVRLPARVVQQTSRGLALEIERLDEVSRQRLRQLPFKQGTSKGVGRAVSSTARGLPNQDIPHEPAGQAGLSTPRLVILNHEPVGRWQLEQIAPERVLLDVMAHRGWGVLEIASPDLCRQVILHNGYVLDIQCDPDQDAESTSSLLLRAGQISKEQWEHARRHAADHDIDVDEGLVAIGALSYRHLMLAMKSRLITLTDALLNQRRGLARFFPLALPPQHYVAPPVAIGARVVNHVYRHYADFDAEALRSLCESRYGHRLLATSRRAPVDIDELGLEPAGQRMFEALQTHPRPLKAVLALAPDRPRATMILLLTLDHINLLVVTRGRPQNLATFGADKARYEDIQDFYGRILTDDHFAVLGLHWSTYDQEIQEAYLRLSQRYAPCDQFADLALRSKLEAINERIQKAYDAICRPAKRAAYRQALIEPSTVTTALDMLRRQAATARLQCDLDTAIDACCRIVELDPDDNQAREDLKQLRPIRLRSSASRR